MTEEEFLRKYDLTKYPRPSVTCDAIPVRIIDGTIKVLLIKRKGHPYIGKWAIPGGFLNMDENLMEGAIRELQEETNLSPIDMFYIRPFDKVDRDPRGRIISNAFIALIADNAIEFAKDDAKEAKWFDLTYSIENDILFIYLKEKNISIVTSLKIETISNNRKVYTILNKGGIAFDHSEVLAYGLDVIIKNIIK